MQLVTSVIERRQTLPILSNVFLSLDKETSIFTRNRYGSRVIRARFARKIGAMW
ncbi:hypothetical protein [Rickettsiella massiliensis]|uniref:hypothetical protein n=1 Tax=Rickettsiella massiliensis TaxID=676517 RepID=UPI00192B3541